jgi:pimeloyl-ACP methyl ester carboxylesterase
MKNNILLAAMIVLAATHAALAVDLSGTWQGTIKNQHVLKLTKKPGGGYQGEWFNLGQEQEGTLNGNPISSVEFDGTHLKFMPGLKSNTYEGELSADGNRFTGTWGPSKIQRQKLDLVRATKKTAWVIDPSPHKTRFVTVDKGVRLEVLDWGGPTGAENGPPLVFLTGLGDTAHVFDSFAPKFTSKHHVYGITRRGFGVSSAPSPTDGAAYDADRLGDDVLAVLAALKIDRPILAGHSIAGQELSSIGTRHPEKIAGLIYLDSAYPYALYDPAHVGMITDIIVLRHELEQVGIVPVPEARTMLSDMLDTRLPRLQKALQEFQQRLAPVPDTEGPQSAPTQQILIRNAIILGAHQYTQITNPALVLMAFPQDMLRNDTSARAKTALEQGAAQAAAVEAGMPNAKVIKLAYANHYLFRSNEAEVERDMNDFMDGLHS